MKERHCEEEQRLSWKESNLNHIEDCRAALAMTDKEVEEIAQYLLPKGRASEWNQALMDYSSAVLKKEKVPIPKQSNFLSSKRYVRGQIIKLLLSVEKIEKDDLIAKLQNLYGMSKDKADQQLREIENIFYSEEFRNHWNELTQR